jgi:hypothetical protein
LPGVRLPERTSPPGRKQVEEVGAPDGAAGRAQPSGDLGGGAVVAGTDTRRDDDDLVLHGREGWALRAEETLNASAAVGDAVARAGLAPVERRAKLLADLNAQMAELGTLTSELVELARDESTREAAEEVELLRSS